MNFDELDQKMRVYETAADTCVLPDMYMVARLDGRGFTRLTKEVCAFERPFDVKFRDMMVRTTKALLSWGFRIVYAFTESDEISLLFDREEQLFGRKLRKLNSLLAGEASAQFSLQLGQVATFDCRISQLPNQDRVIDYFRWRSADAARNALNAHCYWCLRKEGRDARQATQELSGLTFGQKNELLFQRGINFNDLPAWQKQGIAIYWEEFDKPAVNPLTGESVVALRRRLTINDQLPRKAEYTEFLTQLLDAS